LRRCGQAYQQQRIQLQNTVLRQQRRGFAAEGEHGEKKINFWEGPTRISEWKEEQIVLGVLSAWGIGIYTALKVFGGKKEEPAAAH